MHEDVCMVAILRGGCPAACCLRTSAESSGSSELLMTSVTSSVLRLSLTAISAASFLSRANRMIFAIVAKLAVAPDGGLPGALRLRLHAIRLVSTSNTAAVFGDSLRSVPWGSGSAAVARSTQRPGSLTSRPYSSSPFKETMFGVDIALRVDAMWKGGKERPARSVWRVCTLPPSNHQEKSSSD